MERVDASWANYTQTLAVAPMMVDLKRAVQHVVIRSSVSGATRVLRYKIVRPALLWIYAVGRRVGAVYVPARCSRVRCDRDLSCGPSIHRQSHHSPGACCN